ncbi:MAG: hypothetical protein Gaeavirus6_7 [Gaeavirus sp.]|uniref:Uncharacterized protein n=1 Tax=Gaeavirus sp. TaxID=2487767 RepID=A0A3G4ZYS0_9VIRU|nr:MAG: hypothetical protein Gaeavirus6_7 [Gaeavirus sp.]
MDNYYFIAGKDNLENISKLEISDVFDVKDKTGRRLILSKLQYNNAKFYIETNFLKVLSIDVPKNRIILELDQYTENLLSTIDDKCINLISELFDDNDKLRNIEINIESELSFRTLVQSQAQAQAQEKSFQVQVQVQSQSKTTKLYIDLDTNIILNNDNININSIKPNDMLRTLIGIESINLYPAESVCFTRTYCHMAEIYRSNLIKLEKRININNYSFSSDIKSIFKEEIILEDQSFDFTKTEVEIEQEHEHEHEPKSSDSSTHHQTLNSNMETIQEDTEEPTTSTEPSKPKTTRKYNKKIQPKHQATTRKKKTA